MTIFKKATQAKTASPNDKSFDLRRILGRSRDGLAIYEPSSSGYSVYIGGAGSGKTTGVTIPYAWSVRSESLS